MVAGASRGAGRGIALALGAAGATVYVTGRTRRGGAPPPDGAPGTIEDSAEEVSARGGHGIAVACDHTRAAAVAALVERVRRDHGGLDLLVNAVWGGNERYGAGHALLRAGDLATEYRFTDTDGRVIPPFEPPG